MANNPISMVKIRQILRLHSQGTSKVQIVVQTGTSRNTLKRYLKEFEGSKLTYDEITVLSDKDLEDLFVKPGDKQLPDMLQQLFSLFPGIDKALKKKGVTQLVLWQEYKRNLPDGLGRSRTHRAFKISLESGKAETYTPDEIIAHLIDTEWDDRQNRGVEQKIKNARFRYKAVLEDLHYSSDRNVDKNQIMRFTDCSFINRSENILITGNTGIGKSYIASALGHHACSLGYRVAYYNVAKLFAKLKMGESRWLLYQRSGKDRTTALAYT